MSYLVLARKSRPANFDQVVGQKPVVRTLQNALSQNRVAHAMIFSGVRGVGKTTLARIMAKSLNCEAYQETGPCGSCRSCTDIGVGSSVDLVEIDGASNRGIQEIRELKENIRFMPTSSKYKIIIIDEVHMLTTEAFNALLKTLEEPPEHVYFMFATTELHKVPVTILSRCQRYELKRIDNRELTAHFSRLARDEGVEVEPAALAVIVREAAGSVRDGLSLLDQVFSYCGSKVTLDEVTDMLGLVNHQVIADIAQALLASDLGLALERLDRVYEYGMDIKRFINDLLSWFRTLVICSISSKQSELIDLPDELLALAEDCTKKYSGRTLVLMFNILMEQLEKAGFSSQPRFALEMAFIKAVQVNEVVPVTTLLGRLDQVLAGTDTFTPQDSGGSKAGQGNGGSDAPAQRVRDSAPAAQDRPEQVKASAPEKKNKQEDEVVKKTDTAAAPVEKDVSSVEKVDTGTQDTVEVSEAMPRQKTEPRNVRQHWNEFIEYVRDRKRWMSSALRVASGVQLEGNVLVIEFEDPAECSLLKNRENITLLTEFALDFFQENFRIRFSLPDAASCAIDPDNGISPLQERKSLANDALVLTAVDVFNGEVGDVRVGPRFRKPMNKSERKKSDGSPESA